jgi:putative hydrolase of the HAD superfamily
MRRHVIFDIGGVLLNFDLPGLAARAARGNPEGAAALLALREHDSLRQLESGHMTGVAYFEQFIRPVAPHWTFRDLIEGWKSIFSENAEGLALVALARARGASSVTFLSNLADFNRIAIEEKFPGLLDRSDRNFFSYELGCMKPEPVIFQRVLDSLGARPEQCVFYDDTPGHVAAARRLGLKGVVFEPGRGAQFAADLNDWISLKTA